MANFRVKSFNNKPADVLQFDAKRFMNFTTARKKGNIFRLNMFPLFRAVVKFCSANRLCNHKFMHNNFSGSKWLFLN